MPYINKKDRLELDDFKSNRFMTPQTAGELNYLFTKICLSYIGIQGENYQNYNDVLGALEGCKLELYRRRIQVYEDKKIKMNSDVY